MSLNGTSRTVARTAADGGRLPFAGRAALANGPERTLQGLLVPRADHSTEDVTLFSGSGRPA